MAKVVLVDGNSLLFRAYFATSNGRSGFKMQTSFGVSTNAIFAFSQMLMKCIETEQPDYMCVAFDAGKSTFRHQMFPEYKGKRKETEPELVQQFSVAREFLDAFGIKRYESDAYEADDIVGTLAKQSESIGHAHIFTSDRDLLQCISDSTSVHLLAKGMSNQEIMNLTALKEKYDLTPQQFIDFKALQGDKSDNIPGLPGIGEKTATNLLKQYGSLANIIENSDSIKGKVGKTIAENIELANICKQLVTIKTDCDLPFTVKDCLLNLNYATLYDFFIKYEMNALASRIESKINLSANDQEYVDVEMEVVTSIDSSLLVNNNVVVVDHNSELYGGVEVFGLAVGNRNKKQFIYFNDVKNDNALMDYLTNDSILKIVYDAKSAIVSLHQEGIELKGISDDPMILASLSDSTATSSAKIAQRFGLKNNISREQLYGKFDKPKMRDDQLAYTYCSHMIDDCLTLMDQCLPIIQSFECVSLYNDVEMPLMHILAQMEIQGICVKVETLRQLADTLNIQIKTLEANIYQACGCTFNINSPKQLGSVLFDQLNLPTTNNKKRSTSAEVLENLVGQHEVIDYLLDYRKLGKIYSTYALGLEKFISKDAKIHTTFNQAATQTGRLSSSDPNLQNISVRDEQGKQIRKAFVPSDNHLLLSCDYSQVELRMLAHMANESKMIDAFHQGIDIHTKTAMDVFGLAADEVDSNHRRQAKAVNFGIVYGMSDFGLATQLGITRKAAQAFIDKYLQTYPGIQQYMNSIVDFCDKNGYVKTITNRRREIPEIHDKSFTMRSFGKRAAMNAPIQGSAADLIKIAMIKVDKAMKQANVKSKMLLQVHDELIFDVVEEEKEIMTKLVKETMENAMHLSVPLKAECQFGSDWYEAK